MSTTKITELNSDTLFQNMLDSDAEIVCGGVSFLDKLRAILPPPIFLERSRCKVGSMFKRLFA